MKFCFVLFYDESDPVTYKTGSRTKPHSDKTPLTNTHFGHKILYKINFLYIYIYKLLKNIYMCVCVYVCLNFNNYLTCFTVIVVIIP